MRLDPLVKSSGTALELALVYARRFPEADTAAQRVMRLDSTFALTILPLSLAGSLTGHADSAVRTLERGAALHPDSPPLPKFQLFALAAAGKWADAQRLRDKLRRPGGDPTGGVDAAFAELVFGNPEPMVQLMSTEAGRRRWTETSFLGCNPFLDPLWPDARFRAEMRTMGIEPCPLARPWPFKAPRG